jgi:hypothetical protein
MTRSGSPKPDQSVRAARLSVDRVEGAHPRATIIPCGEAAGQRTERDEQEPHCLTGSFTGIAELDRIAKHVPVGGEMRAHIGLAQYMFPFQRLPRSGFISDSA